MSGRSAEKHSKWREAGQGPYIDMLNKTRMTSKQD